MPSWPILLGTAALIVVSVVLSVMYRLGSFKPVAIERISKAGPFILLTRDHLGAYQGIAKMITEIETWARTQGEPCELTFGEYFDNPEQVDEDRLHSRGGCILSGPEKAEELKAKLPTGLTISPIEFSDALSIVFDGSPSIGPLKVYPKAFAYMASQDLASSGPVFEIYKILSPTTGQTRYLFPVKSARQ